MKGNINQFTVHPDNLRIYGEPDDGLKDNIGQFGLQHAIIVNSANQILSGARRHKACLALGMEEIEYEVKDPGDADATTLYILNANAYREKKVGWTHKLEADEYLRLYKSGRVTKDDLRSMAGEQGQLMSRGHEVTKGTEWNENSQINLAARAAGFSPTTYNRYRYVTDGVAATEIEKAQESSEITHESAVQLKKELKNTALQVKAGMKDAKPAANHIREEIRKAKRTPKDPSVIRQEEALEKVKKATAISKQYLAIMRELLDDYSDLLGMFDAMAFAGFVFDLRDELMEMSNRGVLMLPEASDV